MTPLVSIVMPAYNTERYIEAAVRSVLAQTLTDWELIIVDDGSTDGTASVIDAFDDPRIIALHKPNGGIGSARNKALEVASGTYLCFLDADDVMPRRSLEARVAEFLKDPGLGMVDGRVRVMDATLESERRVFMPQRTDDAFHELITFSGRCFMGPSWMLRWDLDRNLRFEEGITHAEDLFFFLRFCKGRRYGFTKEDILFYRRTGHSSMTTNLEGMERSLIHIGHELRRRGLASFLELTVYTLRRKRMMFGSFRQRGRYGMALRALLR
ncbi:MAG: glycosyltransferase family 2 protein [Flavobacteriales bacterium]|nr:glycosyltransferase family 2 protein [Flavobacteriales bacterium]MBK7940375.1 glycosyltransferase family 2 protein [Flavobacteriales bacterium]MBK9699465.1 glycosyltransferase family 2 protein [Flavobacteriales bacterium]